MSPKPRESADLATFTVEILNGELHFLYSVVSWKYQQSSEIIVQNFVNVSR